MTSIANPSVIIQSSSRARACPPPWFGEVVLIAEHLRQQGVLTTICERVRFARRRMGIYEVIDFLVVLFGYAISGERTLEAFYEALRPFSQPFMALFGRDRLPSRSALSRDLSCAPLGGGRSPARPLPRRPAGSSSGQRQADGRAGGPLWWKPPGFRH